MDSTTTTTREPRPHREFDARDVARRGGALGQRRPSAHGGRAFTLVEVLVATTLSSMVLAAVLTCFLFLGRAGVGLQNYADMESQARAAIETFALDARMASDARWNSAQSLTLTIRRAGGNISATYAYDPVARTFTRSVPGAAAEVLLTDIRSFSFNAYGIDTGAISLDTITTATHRDTKQVQISLETERVRRSLAASTNKVISARFVLRNKRVA